jgi:tRNA modification GTPase
MAMDEENRPGSAREQTDFEQTGFADSIVALSSGPLPAGVAVIRMSGSMTRFAVETISGALPKPRRAVLRSLVDADGAAIDTGLVVFFDKPRSFTGEDVAEFHVHGGRATVAALLRALTALDGVRHAEAGEFTRRAFLNGKLDLTATEALADLVQAETEAQRRFAMVGASGAHSALYLGWRRRLLHARAMIEAEIDFADEDDVPGSVADAVWTDLRSLAGEIDRHVAGFHAAEIIRGGFDVVILGAPNAGKSSLFNALARREAAIVTDEPGTTRDLLEVSLDIGGFKIRVTDTAGLRHGGGRIENIGMERARERARQADLVLLLEDMAAAAQPVDTGAVGSSMLRVGTKADLLGEAVGGDFDHTISVRTGLGVDALLTEIGNRAATRAGGAGDILPFRLRHVELLEETRNFMRLAIQGIDLELRAEELRLAADRLGRIVGAVDVEDLLDVIFAQFCIGK